MNRRTIPPSGSGTICLVVLFLFCVFSNQLHAQTPQFIDSAPPDETVMECLEDIPEATTLTAEVIQTAGGSPVEVEITATESVISGSICDGGELERTWTAADFDGSSVSEVQVITFAAPPADDGPTINRTGLPARTITVDCREVDNAENPDSYARWLNERRIAVNPAVDPTRITEGCAPLSDVIDNAPNTMPFFGCPNGTLIVTFSAVDECGGTDTVDFTYITVDTVAPVIFGTGPDTLDLSCDEPIIPPGDAVAEDCNTVDNANPVVMETIIPIGDGDCATYNYDIQRIWRAEDACGNVARDTQLVRIRDTEAPTFTIAGTVNLSCEQDPTNTTITGTPANLSDNCAPVEDLQVTFTDVVTPSISCPQDFVVTRSWTVTDPCGNTRLIQQEIRVQDDEAPTFIGPDDITVDCQDFDNPDITGRPTFLRDNCDGTVNLEFDDRIISQECRGEFTAVRRWRIFDDCGNREFFEQNIAVIDTVPPVFTVAPRELVTSCNNERSQEQIFQEWLADLAGARFTDECGDSTTVTVTIVETGSSAFPVLPDLSCAAQDGTVRRISIDIRISDDCGNTSVATAEYRQVDEVDINLFDCPQSQQIPTEPGTCQASVALPPPVIQDQCVSGLPLVLTNNDTVGVTSAATTQIERGNTPVDAVVLNFDVGDELPVNAQQDGKIMFKLENMDAEGEDEFFLIYGEDRTLLGTSERTDVQCGDVIFEVDLPFDRFNRYAVDGTVTITLEPNIPTDKEGTFAINDVCEDGSRILGRIEQPIFRLTDIFYDVIIDGGEPIRVDPIDTLFTILDEGLHDIVYRATDCGGNTDECLFTITVEDREPPIVTCPADVTIDLDPDSCAITLEMALPTMVEDNCPPFVIQTDQVPSLDKRLFTFRLEPSTGDYLANSLPIVLSNIPSGLIDSVDFEVTYRGNFTGDDTFLDLVLADATILASSAGNTTCNQNGRISAKLSAAEFRSRISSDGGFGLSLQPRGLPPCDPAQVTANGQDDGVSFAFVDVTYRVIRPAYFSTGATVTPLTQITEDNPVPRITFNQGITDFQYVVTDRGGNQDTCSINVTVRDVTAPIARCQAAMIRVDPSGLSPVMVDPLLVDGGSTDNCMIDSFSLSPSTFGCDRIGDTQQVTLTVRDADGNEDQCTANLSIQALPPSPTASTTVCGGDTLLLVANPPTIAAPGQTVYTFRWFGPDGNLLSTQENPIIPGVDASNSGEYRVVIRGVTGCEAEASAAIVIGQIPSAPELVTPNAVCIGDDAELSTPSAYIGSNIRFQWFRGTPANATLLGETTDSTFSAPFADGEILGDFFVRAIVNGCVSPPSAINRVRTTDRPTVAIDDRTLSACELGAVTFTALITDNVEYRWTGPNGFDTTGRIITLPELAIADAGTYFLRGVRNEGCFSEIDSLQLSLLPAGEPTELIGGGAVCPSDTLTLTAATNSAQFYVFNGPNGQSIQSDDPVLHITPVTDSLIGDWTVRIQGEQCLSRPSDPVTVNLGTRPEISAETVPDPVCDGNNLVLQAISNISGSSYEWSGPNGFSSNSIAPTIPDADSTANGLYFLTVTGPNGCFTRDTLEIDVADGVIIDSISIAQGNCLIGGETVAIVAAIDSSSAGSEYTFSWQGPEGTSTNDTFFVPNVSLASNGTYELTVMNEAGCASPVFRTSLELDFAPAAPVTPFSETGVTSVCTGDDVLLMTNDYGPGISYLWRLPNGTNIPTNQNRLRIFNLTESLSGAYTVRAIRNGCSSLPSEARNISVTPFPEITVMSNGPACGNQAIEFQATDIAGAVYSWRGPNNFSSSLPDPTIATADSSVHTGRYSVVASIDGCASDTAFVDVNVLPSPAVPVIQPIQSVCLSDADAVLELRINPNTATPGASYQWFISNGEVEVGEPTTDLTLSLTDLSLFSEGGAFNFTVRSLLDGCFSNESSPMSVQLDAAGTEVADAGRDSTICAGLYLLEAARINSGSGRWTLVEGTGDIDIVNPNVATTAVSGMTELGGPYRFAWTLSNGSCLAYASDTVTIEVTDGEAAIGGENVLACIREEVSLDGSQVQLPGSLGTWSQSLAQELLGVDIVSPNDAKTVITGLQPDNVYSFTWEVVSSCGVKTDVVLVNVSDTSPFAGEDATVCNADRTTTLNADPPTIGSAGRWTSLNEEVILVEPDSNASPVNNLLPGENVFIWEVDGGTCGPRSRDTVSIFYKAPAQPRDDEITVGFQGEITFDPTQNDINPEGSTIRFLAPPPSGTLIDNGDGTYTYRAADNFVGETEFDYEVTSDGCSTSIATVFVLVGQTVDCTAPNIFTPNNDGMNDNFVVPCLIDQSRFPESQLTVYNQWGDEVFRSETPYQNDWEGTYQGNPLPVATYFYILDFGGQRENMSGDVRIER